MAAERKTLTQLSVPICLETLFYMLSGMVDTLMLSSVSDQAVGAYKIKFLNISAQIAVPMIFFRLPCHSP